MKKLVDRSKALRTLSIQFKNRKFLEFAKEQIQLLPFLFSQLRIEKFIADGLSKKYINEALNETRHEGYHQQLHHSFEGSTERLAYTEAYINYLYDVYPYDVIASRDLIEASDLRTPQNWYPETRKTSRKVIYHHGPTNSGKTSAALEALKKSKSGIYMAPLRLLAWQTQQKLMPCNLITGQEKNIIGSPLTSCTIETTDLGGTFDTAVIDQVQLLGDPERGWAWTQALLGTNAKQLHLCGEGRALELVSKLVQATGDTIEERTYKRLSKLKLIRQPYDLKNDLKPGDCIIAFSSKTLYELRNQINEMTSENRENRVAIIYGKLPPEVRKAQAKLFNEGTLPYLVSTNAIGLGLNLKIKRVIFSEIQKRTRNSFGVAQPHLIQQIAGRAGRGQDDGYVQAFKPQHMIIIKKALVNANKGINIEDETGNIAKQNQSTNQKLIFSQVLGRNISQSQRNITSAGIFIALSRIQRYKFIMESLLSEPVKLSEVLNHFIQSSQQKKEFNIQRLQDFKLLADDLEPIQLNLKDQYNFSMSPIDHRSKQLRQFLIDCARDFKYRGVVMLPTNIIDHIERKFANCKTTRDVIFLEKVYQILQLYIWLANKYEMAFPMLQQAINGKISINNRIHTILCNKNKEKTELTLTLDSQ